MDKLIKARDEFERLSRLNECLRKLEKASRLKISGTTYPIEPMSREELDVLITLIRMVLE